MAPMSETAGTLAGYILGLFTGSVSFLRKARMFHPRGILFEAEARCPELPKFAMVRMSTATWKDKEWIDVLGVSVRLMEKAPQGVTADSHDQDLLFATVRFPLQTPFAPFLTRFKDFFRNDYYAVSPFRYKGNIVYFKLSPQNGNEEFGSRRKNLMDAVNSGKAIFNLRVRVKGEKMWKTMGSIKLKEVLSLDQEALRFDPFLNGLGIRPVGFVHHLRKGAYRLSQLARPNSVSEREK